MKMIYKGKLVLLMAFHLLWGLVLWLSISKYSMGVSTDAVHYMFTGLSLSWGQGFISYDCSHYALWPPLYPTLIGGTHLATGLDPFASAILLQFVAFGQLAYCLSVLFLRILSENFVLAFLGCFMSQSESSPTQAAVPILATFLGGIPQ
jgi:hypothetical protein